MGINDLVLRWTHDGEAAPPPNKDMISIEKAIGIWPSLLSGIEKSQNNQGKRRDFTGWNSLISIPVPEHEVFHPPVGKEHRLILHELMAILEAPTKRRKLYCLNEKKIREATGECGLPIVSRRPLIFLSQNFHQVTANPLIFDVVLDFFDLLETLAFLLCERLPKRQKEDLEIENEKGDIRIDRAKDYSMRPPEDVVEQLNDILGAIDDAFSLRLRRIYPEDPVRDLSLDLRSQDHQILLAADAVMKSAVAIFRKDVLGVIDDKLPGHSDEVKRTVGAVLRLKFQSGMNARPLKALRLPPIGTNDGKQFTHLAIFEGDYPHLISILVYADFFHESFHLIFEELAYQDPEGTLPTFASRVKELTYRPSPDTDDESVALACREMFVHFMMLRFIFDGDAELLIRDHLQVVAQAVDRRSEVKDRRNGRLRIEERARRFAEQAYHVLGPIIWLSARLDLKEGEEDTDAISLCEAESERKGLPVSLRSAPLTLENFAQNVWKALEEKRDSFPDYQWIFENDYSEEAKGIFITSALTSVK
ncbi:MAG: hypothetical protein KDN20_14285, partial [Verrucomicrobiae bacterium]|nr:hypothetical protein [Verrucomicrobiae bacterium]